MLHGSASSIGGRFVRGGLSGGISIELTSSGIPFVREQELQIHYKGSLLNKKYKADFVCYEKIIVELKAVQDFRRCSYDAGD